MPNDVDVAFPIGAILITSVQINPAIGFGFGIWQFIAVDKNLIKPRDAYIYERIG